MACGSGLADEFGDEDFHDDAVVGAGIAEAPVGVVDELDGTLELGLSEFADGLVDLFGSRSPHGDSEAGEVALNLAGVFEAGLAGDESEAKLRGEEGQGKGKVFALAYQGIEDGKGTCAVAASEGVDEGEDGGGPGVWDELGDVVHGDGAIAGEERELLDFDGDAGDIGAESFDEEIERGGIHAESRAADERFGLGAGFGGGEFVQFDDIGDGCVELADAILLALVFAFEIEADGFEDEGHAGCRIFEVGGKRSGVAGGGGSVVAGILVGSGHAAFGKCEFGIDNPDEALGGKEGESAGVIEDFGEGDFGEIVLRDGAFGKGGEERVFDAAAFVGLGTEQERGGRKGGFLNAGLELGGGQKASRIALTTERATSLLRRSMAVPLSSK